MSGSSPSGPQGVAGANRRGGHNPVGGTCRARQTRVERTDALDRWRGEEIPRGESEVFGPRIGGAAGP